MYVCIIMYVCMYECLLYRCTVCVYIHVCVCTVGVFMYLCMCVRVCMYVCMYVRMYVCVCMCICMYLFIMYVCSYVCVCIVMFPSLNITMDVQPRYFKYYWQHRPDQGCGSSNWWRIKLSRFFNLGREISTEKIGYKVLQFIFFFGRMPELSFIITEIWNCLFQYIKYKFVLYCIIYCTSFLSFQFPWIIWSFENNKCRLAIDGTIQGSINWPVYHSCNRAFCYKLLYKVFYMSFNC